MTVEYWLGLVTIPVLFLLGWGVIFVVSRLVERGNEWKPQYLTDLPRRADYAAAMVAARQVTLVTAFGHRCAVWRLGARADERSQVWAATRDAITNELGADLAEPAFDDPNRALLRPFYNDPR